MSEQFDLVIIGAGPGGYSTALRAAELGMKVALVERDATVGGTCLNRGCIPSKALITATHTIDTVHRAAELGVNASVNGIDFGTLRDYRLRVVKTMVGGLAGLLAHRGITVFRANAAFHADETAPATSNHIVHLVPSPDQSDILTYHKADVPEPSGPTMDLTATNIVIATGAKPRPLPGNPFAGALIDSTQALEVNEFPSSAVIIGAGAIALEFASMWNAAGSKVTLLIRKDRVLSAWDRRAGTTLTRELKRHGVNIITRASVTHVDASKGMVAWARENAAASGLAERPCRWIVDDCVKFVQREIRRGSKYDAVIMDPPSYGRGPGGEVWKLETNLWPFVELVSGVLSDDPLFVIINSYTTGLSPSVLTYLSESIFTRRFGGRSESQELGLPVAASGLVLPCGAACRWER